MAAVPPPAARALEGEPLSAAAIEARLDEHLDLVLSSRRTAAGPARELAAFSRAEQELVLRWVAVLAAAHAELAYQFASLAPRALRLMDEAGVEAWVRQAMDTYDSAGLYPAVAALREVEAFAERARARAAGLALEEVAGVLERYVRGLGGRPLKVEAGEAPWTDTETLHLPPVLGVLGDREGNFRLYKAMAVCLWAQCWFGTWRAPLLARLREAGAEAAALYAALEALRLEARLARALPGARRELDTLAAALAVAPWPEPWPEAARRLAAPEATAADSLELALAWAGRVALPPPRPWEGPPRPEAVAAVLEARLERERRSLRRELAALAEEQRGAVPDPVRLEAAPFTLERIEDPAAPEGFTFRLELDGQPIEPPEEVRGLLTSIVQDLGEIPEEYLVPAGPGEYDAGAQPAGRDPRDVWKGMYHEEGAHLHDEWDYRRGHYRKRWCVLRELDVHPVRDGFVERTLRRHRGLVASLRRTFEALRGEDRLLRRQPEGEEVDIDALVEAYADAATGQEMTDRLFVRKRREERNIAVLFMVDMSGSTKGWINDAEREALVLLCESLETLGDRYAIYGFSGMTRKRCELYRIKRFDEPYSDEVRARISGIRPQDYTRMGVAIRHLTGMLREVEARTKLLVTLSDGKPDDFDGYRGTYGIEDTRMALVEARREGIHPFCITIDREARDYLPHLYGPANYVVVDEVRKLPFKVSDVYRKLTS